MFKKLFLSIFLLLCFFGILGNPNTNAQNIENKATIYLFWGEGCPHCAKEKEFLGKIKDKYNNLSIIDYEVWYNKDNAELLKKVGEKLNTNISGVPFTIIGNKTISGYYNDQVTGKKIEDQVKFCLENRCVDIINEILYKTVTNNQINNDVDTSNTINNNQVNNDVNTNNTINNNQVNNNLDNEKIIKQNKTNNNIILDKNNDDTKIANQSITNENLENSNTLEIDNIQINTNENYNNLHEQKVDNQINTGISEQKIDNKELIDTEIDIPFFGQINLQKYSLPVITIIIGTLDGFNPCAMWILLFLMSMLIGMNDRKKMWILGSAFIFTSAFAYFLFMTAWLKIILFFGFLLWIRVGIGLFAIGGGGFNVFQYFKSKDSGCHVVEEEKRTKTFTKIKDILHKKSFLISLISICILAFGVNVVELLCSAGLPVVYTQILSLNNLSNFQYYLYILLYVFFFMIDDLIIFAIGMLTLKITGITTKYTKYSHLIGGILMLLVGILLIFKPEILMFG